MSRIERIAILGVGLIGGSLGLAWRRAGVAREIVGAGRNRETLEAAVDVGAIDRYTTNFITAIQDADLVVLCAPITTIVGWARDLAPHLKEGAVVTDVGSTKAAIMRAWETALPPERYFVGGHPMAGSEKGGVRAARPDLFEGAPYLIFPGRRTSVRAGTLVAELAQITGARVQLSPEGDADHDKSVAYISHLPQVLAVALAGCVGEYEARSPGAISLAGGGFRDTTRIAESPPDIWVDIFATNQEQVLAALRDFRSALGNLEAAIEQGDWDEVTRLFNAAAAARAKLPPRR